MNEKLVSWFEEILPDIKETGDVNGTMLKFASKKNLAPALLEKLGHVYNTAKTVTYLDKCASEDKGRGETFDVLDVAKLVEDYTDKNASDHSYADNDFTSMSSGRITDLFESKMTFDDLDNLEQSDDYKEIKLASAKRAGWKSDSIKFANAEQAEQLIFDVSEDNRKIASDISDFVRDSYNETSFEDVERDCNHFFGGSIKFACDYVADYMSGIGYSVGRAEDSGKSRLLEDTSLIQKVATIQYNLNNQDNARDFVEDLTKKKIKQATTEHSDIFSDVYPNDLSTLVNTSGADELKERNKLYRLEQGRVDASRKDKQEADKAKTESEREQEKAEKKRQEKLLANQDTYQSEDSTYIDGTAKEREDALSESSEELDKAVRGVAGKGLDIGAETTGALYDSVSNKLGLGNSISDTLGSTRESISGFIDDVAPGRDTGQEHIDTELDNAKYTAVLQDLIITDPILAEEDEDKVIDIYNTIKSVAPELAKDKNVVRVVLRSAVQYDGIAAPDLAQLIEAERSIQKSKNNTNVLASEAYDKNPTGRLSG